MLNYCLAVVHEPKYGVPCAIETVGRKFHRNLIPKKTGRPKKEKN
jgi:hypothetical protein